MMQQELPKTDSFLNDCFLILYAGVTDLYTFLQMSTLKMFLAYLWTPSSVHPSTFVSLSGTYGTLYYKT